MPAVRSADQTSQRGRSKPYVETLVSPRTAKWQLCLCCWAFASPTTLKAYEHRIALVHRRDCSSRRHLAESGSC